MEGAAVSWSEWYCPRCLLRYLELVGLNLIGPEKRGVIQNVMHAPFRVDRSSLAMKHSPDKNVEECRLSSKTYSACVIITRQPVGPVNICWLLLLLLLHSTSSLLFILASFDSPTLASKPPRMGGYWRTPRADANNMPGPIMTNPTTL